MTTSLVLLEKQNDICVLNFMGLVQDVLFRAVRDQNHSSWNKNERSCIFETKTCDNNDLLETKTIFLKFRDLHIRFYVVRDQTFVFLSDKSRVTRHEVFFYSLSYMNILKTNRFTQFGGIV